MAEVPRWSDAHCQTIQFQPFTFYPDKQVHVQISVSHVNDTSQVHDAAVSWVEDVSDSNFTFCVMESGRNEGPPHGFAAVEYMAYQGAPSGGLAGVVSIPEWWTGTKCQDVDISSVRTDKFWQEKFMSNIFLKRNFENVIQDVCHFQNNFKSISTRDSSIGFGNNFSKAGLFTAHFNVCMGTKFSHR